MSMPLIASISNYRPMSGDRSTKNASKPIPGHVFIDQSPETFAANKSKLVSSQARRFQSAGKRRQLRDSARQDAVYARSLVGWRPSSTTPTNDLDGQSRKAPAKSRTPEQKPRPDPEPEERAESSQTQLSLAVQTGLRIDPFHAFPSSNSKTVMWMVDYHIHVWGPHKAGNFDALMGYNTQLDLCWPLALQDDMLFDATVAVSRVAWVLSQGKSPSEDGLMLYHRGLAMTRLRRRVSVDTTNSQEAVIFTIGRMVSIAYMSSEPEAFLAHFDAFRTIAQQYIDEHPNTDCGRVVQNRLDSWKALNWYRTGYDHLRHCPASELPQFRQDRRPGSSQPLVYPASHSHSQSFLHQLNLPVELSDSINMLSAVLRQVQAVSPSQPQPPQHEKLAFEVAECGREFGQILRDQDLTPVHSQFSCALLAFCLQMQHLLSSGGGTGFFARDQSVLESDLPALEDLAATFLNKKLKGFAGSVEERTVLTWSALVVGSLCLQQQNNSRLRTKGHIIHVALNVALGPGRRDGHRLRVGVSEETDTEEETNGWDVLELELGPLDDSLWVSLPPLIKEQWRSEWQGSMRRQRRWEQQGLFKIGAPRRLTSPGLLVKENPSQGPPMGKSKDKERGRHHRHYADEYEEEIDVIEYLVLREARDSLPRVE